MRAPQNEESHMNREFEPTSSTTRSVLAIAALVVTVSIAGAIDSLATHYANTGSLLQTVASAR